MHRLLTPCLIGWSPLELPWKTAEPHFLFRQLSPNHCPTIAQFNLFFFKALNMNQLEALKKYSTVVADTGDFIQIQQYHPQDATTNPSLILKAIQKPEYQHVLDQVKHLASSESLEMKMDRLIVAFGKEILKLIPGRVSSEVDARLSYDTGKTLERARQMMALYQEEGIDSSRILIKIASTWEGIQAAQVLQQEGIDCNLTLLFSLEQAVACAHARVKLISPFVGRIYDWHKKNLGEAWHERDHTGANDPGVQSVTSIYNYYKKFGIPTEIMGASFRNLDQIRALAGCDLLTISPELLAGLQLNEDELLPALQVKNAQNCSMQELHLDEITFLTRLKANPMAHEKLQEGIASFCADAVKIEQLLQA